jgi:hypothetical protein
MDSPCLSATWSRSRNILDILPCPEPASYEKIEERAARISLFVLKDIMAAIWKEMGLAWEAGAPLLVKTAKTEVPAAERRSRDTLS